MTDSSAVPETTDRAETCKRCHALNVTWFAPSPLWNYVMRGNDIDGEPIWDDLVCMVCFIDLANAQGLTGSWRLTLDPEPEGLIYETPSGRVWDAQQSLWVEPRTDLPTTPGSVIEAKPPGRKKAFLMALTTDGEWRRLDGPFYERGPFRNVAVLFDAGINHD